MACGPIYLDIDASELMGTMNRMKAVMKPKQFENAMYGIFKREAGHIKKILPKDLRRDYVVKAGDVKNAIGNPEIGSGLFGGVGCSIPIKDRRGSIGGRYRASGGAKGWESLKKKYRVRSKIVVAGRTTLPAKMDSYGGQPPFRNTSSKKLNGVTFTRAGKRRFPIMKVVGIAIPQMPLNRSEEKVQNDIRNDLQKQMEKRLSYLIRSGK